MARGAALAGCSAGAMAMGGAVPDVRHPLSGPVDGLGVVPHLSVVPHFDRFGSRLLGAFAGHQLPDGVRLVGVDEKTALVGGPHAWRWWARPARGCSTTTAATNGPSGTSSPSEPATRAPRDRRPCRR